VKDPADGVRYVFSLIDSGLSSEELAWIVRLAETVNPDMVLAEQLDILHLRELAPDLSLGALIAHPFGGLRTGTCRYLAEQAVQAGCSGIALTIPLADVLGGEKISLRNHLSRVASSAKDLELIADVAVGNIPSSGQLEFCIDACLAAGFNHICLGTGTHLDAVCQDHVRMVRKRLRYFGCGGTATLEAAVPFDGRMTDVDIVRISGLESLRRWSGKEIGRQGGQPS